MSNENNYWEKLYEQAEPKPLKFLHADGTIDEDSGAGGGSPITSEEWLDLTNLVQITERFTRTIGDEPTIEISNKGRLKISMRGEYNLTAANLVELKSGNVFTFSVPNATNLITAIKNFSSDLYEFLKINRYGEATVIRIAGNTTNGEIVHFNCIVSPFKITSDTQVSIYIVYKFIVSNVQGSGYNMPPSAGSMIIQF